MLSKKYVLSVLLILGICQINMVVAATTIKKVYKIKGVKASSSPSENAKKVGIKILNKFGSPITTISKSVTSRNPLNSSAQTILNNAPGVSVTSAGPIPMRVHTNIRGFRSVELGYTFDNLPITSFFFGGLNGGDTMQADSYGLQPITSGETSGVSLIYGPPKPSVNSFGAIGGEINYMPLLPSANFSTSVFGGYGSYDTRLYGASVNSGKLGKYGSFVLRYSGKTTNNYLTSTPATTSSYYAAYVLPSRKGDSKLTAIFYLNHSMGIEPLRMPLSLLNKYGRYYQFPSNVSSIGTNGTFIEGLIGYKNVIYKNLIFDSKVYYQDQIYHALQYDNFFLTNPFFGAAQTEYPGPYGSQVSYDPSLSGIEYQYYYVNNKSVGLAPNLEFFNRWIRARVGLLAVAAYSHNGKNVYGSPEVPVVQGYNDAWDEHQNRFYTKFYFQSDMHLLRNLSFYSGIKYEIVSSEDSDDPGIFYPVGASVGNTYARPSGYIGFSYEIAPHYKLYGSYTLAYKYPNMSAYYNQTDQASVGVPPPPVTIVPEFVNSYQAGGAYSDGNIALSIDGYKDYFQDTFSNYTNPISGITFQTNSGASTYEGISTSLNYQLNNIFRVYGNYSLQSAAYGSSFVNQAGTTVNSGSSVQYTPTYLANLGLGFHLHDFDGDLYDNIVGPQYIGTYEGSPTTISIPAYSTLNLNIGYKVPLSLYGIKSVKLGVNFDNILNSDSFSFEKVYPLKGESGNYVEAQPLNPRFFGLDVDVKF